MCSMQIANPRKKPSLSLNLILKQAKTAKNK